LMAVLGSASDCPLALHTVRRHFPNCRTRRRW
jgi:hypothetical protein